MKSKNKTKTSGAKSHEKRLAAFRTVVPVMVEPLAEDARGLADYTVDITMGCPFGCVHCNAPALIPGYWRELLGDADVRKLDDDWGTRYTVKLYNEGSFRASLFYAALEIDLGSVMGRGNDPAASGKMRDRAREILEDESKLRAAMGRKKSVLYSGLSDPYPTIRHKSPAIVKTLTDMIADLRRRTLEIIRDESTLRVVVLTCGRPPEEDLELLKSFGADRVRFGVSVSTMDESIARTYEQHLPAPSERLAVLREAKAHGIPVFVALSPVMPESSAIDVRRTVKAVMEIDPVMVVFTPFQVGGKNVDRIRRRHRDLGLTFETDIDGSLAARKAHVAGWAMRWREFAEEFNIRDRLHLVVDREHFIGWPQADLWAEGGERANGTKGPQAPVASKAEGVDT